MTTVIFYKNNRRHSVSLEKFKQHHAPDESRLFNPKRKPLAHTYWLTKRGGKKVSVSAIVEV